MKPLALILSLLLNAAAAAAFARGSITPQIGGGIGQFDGGISLKKASSGPPLIACDDMQFDFSVFTGCNMTPFVMLLR